MYSASFQAVHSNHTKLLRIVKILLLTAAALLASSSYAEAQCDKLLGAFNSCPNLRGNSGVVFEPDYVIANGADRGPGVVGVAPSAVADSYTTTGFTTGTEPDAGDYIEFRVAGKDGNQIQVTGLDLAYSRNETGPKQLVIRSSVDGFTEDLFVDTDISTELDGEKNYPRFFPQAGEEIAFRIYAFESFPDSAMGYFYLEGLTSNEHHRFENTSIQVKGCSVDPLPVEMTSFVANAKTTGADLVWEVASELNNDYFAVEVSRDGNTFTEAGRIRGAGTSNSTASYTFDYASNAAAGTYYFRLRQVDYSGEESLSKIVALELDGRAGLSLRSNVVQRDLQLELAAPATLRILNQSGQVLSATALGEGFQRLDVAGLAPGMYVVSDGLTSLRFVK